MKNMEHKAERFIHTSRLASSAPIDQTGAGIEINAYTENGPTCCDCKLSSQKGCTDVCQYRCTKQTAHNTPCDADLCNFWLGSSKPKLNVLHFITAWLRKELGMAKAGTALVCYSRRRAWPPIQIGLNPCLVSNTECDANTQFQGFPSGADSELWIQSCANTFYKLCCRASGYSDVFQLVVIGLVGFQTHQCCLLRSHGHACLSAQGQEPPAGLELVEHSYHRQCTFPHYKIWRCEKITPEIDSYCIFYLVICKVTACCLLTHQKYIFHDV